MGFRLQKHGVSVSPKPRLRRTPVSHSLITPAYLLSPTLAPVFCALQVNWSEGRPTPPASITKYWNQNRYKLRRVTASCHSNRAVLLSSARKKATDTKYCLCRCVFFPIASHENIASKLFGGTFFGIFLQR